MFSDAEFDEWMNAGDTGPSADQKNIYDAYGSLGLVGLGNQNSEGQAGANIALIPQVGFRIHGYEFSKLDRILFYVDIEQSGGVGGGVALGRPSSYAGGQVQVALDLGRVLSDGDSCSTFLGGGTAVGVVAGSATVNQLSESEQKQAGVYLQTESSLAKVSGGVVCEKDGKNILVMPYGSLNIDYFHSDQFRVGTGVKVEYFHRKKYSLTGEVQAAASVMTGDPDLMLAGSLSGNLWLWEKKRKELSTDSRLGLGLDAKVSNKPSFWVSPETGSAIELGGRTTSVMMGVSVRSAF